MMAEPSPFKTFEKVLADVAATMERNSAEKGDSWETLGLLFLHDKVDEEYKEMRLASSAGDKYSEMCDLILISLMFAERLRRAMEPRNDRQ